MRLRNQRKEEQLLFDPDINKTLLLSGIEDV